MERSERSSSTPLLGLRRPDGSITVARSIDREVRSKRFAVVPHFDAPDTCDFELIADTDAARPSSEFEVPAWELRRTPDLAPVLAEHNVHMRLAYDLPA